MAHPPPSAAAQRESQGKKKLVNEEGPRARCEGQTTGHAGQGGPVRATDQRPALATEAILPHSGIGRERVPSYRLPRT
jgi:hypothetical protein